MVLRKGETITNDPPYPLTLCHFTLLKAFVFLVGLLSTFCPSSFHPFVSFFFFLSLLPLSFVDVYLALSLASFLLILSLLSPMSSPFILSLISLHLSHSLRPLSHLSPFLSFPALSLVSFSLISLSLFPPCHFFLRCSFSFSHFSLFLHLPFLTSFLSFISFLFPFLLYFLLLIVIIFLLLPFPFFSPLFLFYFSSFFVLYSSYFAFSVFLPPLHLILLSLCLSFDLDFTL